MAAIPIASSILSAVLPLVPDVVTFVEGLFGPKTGPQKLDAAVTLLTQKVAPVAASIAPQVVDTIKAAVNNEVAAQNASGKLPASAPAASSDAPGSATAITASTVASIATTVASALKAAGPVPAISPTISSAALAPTYWTAIDAFLSASMPPGQAPDGTVTIVWAKGVLKSIQVA